MHANGRVTRPPNPWASQPMVILECSDELANESARLCAGGWVLAAGFSSRPTGMDVVLVGCVDGESDAASALLAALDGYGLLVAAGPDHAVTDRLVDDLRRLGPVVHRRHDEASATAAAGIRVDARAAAILGLLADGHSLGEAASILGISRRTADRRLAEARHALGTDRTTEAVARATRLGWLRR